MGEGQGSRIRGEAEGGRLLGGAVGVGMYDDGARDGNMGWEMYGFGARRLYWGLSKDMMPAMMSLA